VSFRLSGPVTYIWKGRVLDVTLWYKYWFSKLLSCSWVTERMDRRFFVMFTSSPSACACKYGDMGGLGKGLSGGLYSGGDIVRKGLPVNFGDLGE